MNYKEEIKKKFFGLKTLVSFLIAAVIIYILIFNINFAEILDIIKKINIHNYVIAFFLFYISIFIRNLRWQLQLKNTGHAVRYISLFKILISSYFANCIIPAKLGDFVRGYMIKKKYGISFMKTMGTVLTERLIDIFLLIVLLTISGFILFKSKLNQEILIALIIGYIAVIISVIIVFTLRFRKRFEKYLPKRIIGSIDRIEKGVIGSVKNKNFPIIFIYSLLIWLFEITSLYLIFLSLNLSLSYYLAIFIALSAALLTAIPITPAGLGAVDIAIVAVLILVGIDKNMGVSVAILQRFINYVSVLIIGGVTILLNK